MPPTPYIKPLPRYQRRIIFILSLLLFLVTVPLLVFYAIGYRLDFEDETQNFRTVGGMYVSAPAQQAEIYLDDEPVEDMRLFQRAAYIQSITAGQHQVHTQGEGIQTWVKMLPVFSHLVTEVSSFNLPASSTARFIAPYVDETGAPIYRQTQKTQRPFVTATSTPVVFATSSPAQVGQENPEFTFIQTLFASTTADRKLLAAQLDYEEERFSFGAQPLLATTSATTTRVSGDTRLELEGDELYAYWDGAANDIPFYYCVFTGSYASTSERYGSHVADQLYTASALSEEGTLATTTISQNNKLCRTQVRIDRKWQSVIWYEFLPGSSDLVLLQLQDGIYVVEIDDRSWQNVQRLYAGDYLTMLINGDQILVRDGDIYFELLTELPAN